MIDELVQGAKAAAELEPAIEAFGRIFSTYERRTANG
jgi:hypothetical protein